MALSREEVKHIANLARLHLTEEEKERFRQQLSSILEHVAQLGELDTADIPPLTSVLGGEAPLRRDTPAGRRDPAAILANAPDQAAAQFRVPPVFETGEDGEDA